MSDFEKLAVGRMILRLRETKTISEDAYRQCMKKLGIARKMNAASDKQPAATRSEEHTSELQSRFDLVCRLLLEKKKNIIITKRKIGRAT